MTNEKTREQKRELLIDNLSELIGNFAEQNAAKFFDTLGYNPFELFNDSDFISDVYLSDDPERNSIAVLFIELIRYTIDSQPNDVIVYANDNSRYSIQPLVYSVSVQYPYLG